MKNFWVVLVVGVLGLGCAKSQEAARIMETGKLKFAEAKVEDLGKQPDAYWFERMTPAQYHVMRDEGTERAGTSPLNDEHRAGLFVCSACALPLFASAAKFDSGTGWPSFFQPIDPKAVETRVDGKLFFKRTEVHCARCGGHLGHVFTDGPKPTGLRYCMNGVSLYFEPK